MSFFSGALNQVSSFWNQPAAAAAPATAAFTPAPAAAPQMSVAPQMSMASPEAVARVFGSQYDAVGERNDCYTPDLTQGGFSSLMDENRPTDLPYCPGFESFAPLGDTLTSNNSAIESTMARLLGIQRPAGAAERVGPRPDSLGRLIDEQHGRAVTGGAIETAGTLAAMGMPHVAGAQGPVQHAMAEIATDVNASHVGGLATGEFGPESAGLGVLSAVANWGIGPGAGLVLSSMVHGLMDGDERVEAAHRDTEAIHHQDEQLAAGRAIQQMCFEATDHAAVVNGNISLPAAVSTDGDCWDGANSALRMRHYDGVGPAVRRQNAAANGGK